MNSYEYIPVDSATQSTKTSSESNLWTITKIPEHVYYELFY
jgi:hypothetical protein